jgi:hypothetical protein
MSPSAPPLSMTWTNAALQELVLQLELEQPPTPEQFSDLEKLVASFVAMGGYGGFVRETVSPFESSLRIVQTNFSSPTKPAFLLEALQLDVRAFQLLRHGAWRWSARAQGVKAITVDDRTRGAAARPVQLPDPTWNTEEMAYPPSSQLIQFRIERGDPADYQKERRCVVEFGRVVPNGVFESAIIPIGAWVALANEGAYGPPVRPSFEAEVWQENLGPYDEYSVELALSLFEASETAWNSLLNCIERYSHSTERVALVTIE